VVSGSQTVYTDPADVIAPYESAARMANTENVDRVFVSDRTSAGRRVGNTLGRAAWLMVQAATLSATNQELLSLNGLNYPNEAFLPNIAAFLNSLNAAARALQRSA
jgi:hypothetical protein